MTDLDPSNILEPMNPRLKEPGLFEAACADLERYFQRNVKARKTKECDGRKARSGKQTGNYSHDDSVTDNGNFGPAESSSDQSRSSSVDNTNKQDNAKSIEDEDNLIKCNGKSLLPQVDNDQQSIVQIAEEDGDSKKKGRPRKGILAANKERNSIVGTIAGLDSLHETTLAYLAAAKSDASVPHGCIEERLNRFAPRTCIDHVELGQSLKANGEGGHIPFQLQRLLENLKKEYLDFIRAMQEPSFKARVEADILAERQRKDELVKREKQLKAQIENLVSNSLGLLRCRLGELGIQAKDSPEFIEKAKAIVCSHHDLQRKKIGLEAEIRQLELEGEKLERKGREDTDKQAKERIGKQQVLNQAINVSSSTPEARVVPLLNKLSEVTFTKCPGTTISFDGVHLISTQIRKRSREPSEEDWLEKRTKIIAREEEREFPRKASSATLLISPTKSRQHLAKEAHAIPSPSKATSIYAPPPSATYQLFSKSVELPRLDLTAAMQASSTSSSAAIPSISRSDYSEHNTEDHSFGKNRVTTTPRAEQFEDRLKTIIQSVLSSDSMDKRKNLESPHQKQMLSGPVIHMMPCRRSPPLPNSRSQTDLKVSPHSDAPCVPFQAVISSHSSIPTHPTRPNMNFKNVPHPAHYSSSSGVSSTCTMNDLIASEIQQGLLVPTSGNKSSSYSNQYRSTPGLPEARPTMARMTQVIEDSIRGETAPSNLYYQPVPQLPSRPSKRELEGLACPRSNSPNSQRQQHYQQLQQQQRLHHQQEQQQRFQQERLAMSPIASPLKSSRNGWSGYDYPAMEGLAARFGPYMDKINREQRYGFPLGGGSSTPDFTQTIKRQDSPQLPKPVLPPKKQHLDDHPDYRLPKDLSCTSLSKPSPPTTPNSYPQMRIPVFTNQSQQPSRAERPLPFQQGIDPRSRMYNAGDFHPEWQDVISSGFDRLVAYANEVDRRRKSPTSTNTPSSPTCYAMRQPRELSPPLQQQSHPPSSSSIPESSNVVPLTPFQSIVFSASNKCPLPGENLPAHHPKKRYFAETRDTSMLE